MDGVVFVATGEGYTRAAVQAARSVREHMACPVDLFTDQPGPFAEFDAVHPVPAPHRRSKVDCLPRTRFDSTLYLDADVRMVADCSDVFRLMERIDLAAAHAHRRASEATRQVWRKDLPDAFPQFNGGVIVYGRAALPLMAAWRDAYHAAGFRKDQVTLRELVWRSDLRIGVLPPEYNLRHAEDLAREGHARARIMHMREFRP